MTFGQNAWKAVRKARSESVSQKKIYGPGWEKWDQETIQVIDQVFAEHIVATLKPLLGALNSCETGHLKYGGWCDWCAGIHTAARNLLGIPDEAHSPLEKP